MDNVRITLVERGADGWNGPGLYVRVQAYKGDRTRSLHLGAELRINSLASALRFIGAFAALASEAFEP